MHQIRRNSERGLADHGWLKSAHTFSFASYHDPEHMGVGPLRVINEDRVAPGMGFGAHSHRDMEIISYVLSGALEHKDSMGNGSVLHYGDVQKMSAGTGVTHSEYNASKTEPVHFLQIWIIPDRQGIAPGYEEKRFDPAAKRGRLTLIASSDGRDGSVQIRQDAVVHAAIVDGADRLEHRVVRRHGYVHVARGEVDVNGTKLTAGDAITFDGPEDIVLGNGRDAEVLVFDLPE